MSEFPAFDAIVVGAGPTGLACGLEVKRRGLPAIQARPDKPDSLRVGQPVSVFLNAKAP